MKNHKLIFSIFSSIPFSFWIAINMMICLFFFSLSYVSAAEYDMADSNNWNIRMDGAAVGDSLSEYAVQTADINENGIPDILVGSDYADNNGRSDSGSLYIIYDELYKEITGMGNTIDLSNSSNYNIRIDGGNTNNYFPSYTIIPEDIDGDGRIDFIIAQNYTDNNGLVRSGSIYIIKNPIFGSITGTGNTIDLANSANYNIRYDGAFAWDLLGYFRSFIAKDINGNGKIDLVFGSATDYNGKLNSGSLYIIYDDLIDDYSGTGNNILLSISTNFNIRIDGAFKTNGFGLNAIDSTDIDNNNSTDLVVGALMGNSGRNLGGSVYIIKNEEFSGLSGLGNIINMVNPGFYFVRIDSASANDFLGYMGDFMAHDLDGDGMNDLVLTAYGTDYNSRSSSGSLYYINNDILSSLTGTDNILDLANSTSFTVRFDGAYVGENLSLGAFYYGDFDKNGTIDLFIGGRAGNNGRSTSGSLYIIYNEIFNKDNIGNIFDLSDTSKYSIRFDGASANDHLTAGSLKIEDLNNDESLDILVGARFADNNGRINSGSLYLLYNYPHSISVDTASYVNDNTPLITGTITATNSVTDIAMVQYSVDGNSFGGDWNNCSADDGTFDSKEEDYSCNVVSALSEGEHTVYIRSYDKNISYTAQDNYGSTTFIVDVTGPTGTISINAGETITNTDEVTLTLSATDNLSGISKMMVSNKGDYSGGTWETYNTSKEWRLSMGDGEKRVYVKYRDEVGNISSSYSDSIEMDMGAPTGTLIINEGEEYTSSREVVLHITGEDEVTGVEEMRISEERTMEGVEWEGYETSREYTLSEGDGYKVIYIQYRDGIGNESEVYGSNITLDRNTEIDITEIGEEEVEGEIENWETEETTPTFTGEGEVGATITIEIEGIETGTVIVNEDGVWSWTPSIELTRGQEYNVTITSTDLAGNEDIQTFILGILDEEVIDVNQTTPEAQETATQLPNTGVILIVGLMILGGVFWTGMNFKVIRKLR